MSPRSLKSLGVCRAVLWGVLCGALWIVGGRASAADDIDPAAVRDALRRATEYLRRGQMDDGSWGAIGQHETTGLCALALLNAGVKPDDPTIQKALANMRKQKPRLTYEVALQTMVFCLAEPDKDMLTIRRHARWLEDNQIKGGPMEGSWGYPGSSGDNSNAQFALLALHEAELVGVEVSEATWRRSLTYWQNGQNDDGSWGYKPQDKPGTGSMTCAGIGSLVIVESRLTGGDAAATGTRVECCGNQRPDDNIERALAWLGRNFSVERNPGIVGPQHKFYYLYALERSGRLTARRFIGDHDWYREGVGELLELQDSVSGLWKGAGLGEHLDHVSTSLALLFMAKGRRPILVAKMRYGPDNDWNRHRHDLAHLTTYIEKRWERELTWQTIDLSQATTEDLLQAPVLHITGKFAPEIDDEGVAKLREYVSLGGFIVAEALCEQGPQFDAGFRQLMARVFPEPEHRLRLLEPDHTVWRIEEPLSPDQLRPLWGIEFGCRTSVIYASPDPLDAPRPSLSCLWELASAGKSRKFDAAVQKQLAGAMSLGTNIMAYATNREVRHKEDVYRTATNGRADPSPRGKLRLAKLKHGGGWNVAPGALLALREGLVREAGLRVDTPPLELEVTDPALLNFHLVFMHGRNDFRLSEAARVALKTYVERGGTILIDAVCASPDFSKAVRRELKEIFPDAPLERLPADHPVFSDRFGGFTLNRVRRRDPERVADGSVRTIAREVEPHLEAVRVNDRLGVYFSPFDLSCALENHASAECQGYVRDDAARIGLNVMLYSLQE